MYVVDIEDTTAASSLSRGYILSHLDLLRLRSAKVLSVVIDTHKSASPKLWQAVGFRIRERDVAEVSVLLNETESLLVRAFSELTQGQPGGFEASELVAEKIAQTALQHPAAMVSVTRLKRFDQTTFLHSLSVGMLMILLSRKMGYREEDILTFGLAGIYHDVGKLRIDKRTLRKTGRLTSEEMEIVKTHPSHGYDLLSRDPKVPDVVLDVCLHHHERIDGAGYPDRLSGNEISEAAKISAVCDVYDALTTVRPYKKAWTSVDALNLMTASPGQLDPAIVSSFSDLIMGLPALGGLNDHRRSLA